MSSRLLTISQKATGFSSFQQSRNVIRMLGLPPDEGRSLQKKLKDQNRVDRAFKRVDIGLPSKNGKLRMSAAERSKIIAKAKNDPNLERLARLRQLDVSLEDVEKEWAAFGFASQHIKTIADHYGIFEHLFGDAFFYPEVMLDVGYVQNDEVIVPVYRGNIVKPREALKPPEVKFEADKDSLWTLLVTNLDGHLTEENSEYVHWLIGNIPSNEISKGEVVYDYLPPFPPVGTGYHRLVFLLFKQEGKVDYSNLKKPSPCLDLTLRTFKTLDFYRPRQNVLTPAGLAFCQTDYDFSVKSIFHDLLQMKEPKYEYDFPEHYVNPQKWFPDNVAFNVYLDRYRDPCAINKEYIVDRLKTYDPFLKNKPELQYPGAQYFPRGTPTWLKRKMFFDAMKWGRINDSL